VNGIGQNAYFAARFRELVYDHIQRGRGSPGKTDFAARYRRRAEIGAGLDAVGHDPMPRNATKSAPISMKIARKIWKKGVNFQKTGQIICYSYGQITCSLHTA
jgi:hypothetical protein